MIRTAGIGDLASAAELAALLWPDSTAEEHARELRALLADSGCAVFLAALDGRDIGFAQCQLRHDYVEGTESSPVGYLEGIYVREGFRRRGIARQLLEHCQTWAARRGCREFASDCELTNADSLAFHLKVGFAEANRIICFTKPLAQPEPAGSEER